MQTAQPPLPHEKQDKNVPEDAASAAVTPEVEKHTAASTGHSAAHAAHNTDAAAYLSNNGPHKPSKRHRATEAATPPSPSVATGDVVATGAEGGGLVRKHRRTERRGLEKKGGRAANALVNKWQHVARELEEDDVRCLFVLVALCHRC
jgi:hypothetical protein